MPADGVDEEVASRMAVNRTNKRLSVTERIRKHAIVAPFTVENGLLTPSQKIRRVLVIRAEPAYAWRRCIDGRSLRSISHCGSGDALLDGAAPRSCPGVRVPVAHRAADAAFVLEKSRFHGRTEEKDLPVPPRHAAEPSGPDARGTRRMRQLRRAEAAAPRLQPLRPL